MNTTKNFDISPFIEHTLLKPDATQIQINQLCQEALTHSFKGVCVNSYHIPLVHSILKESSVLIVSVVGFPLGSSFSEVKAFEAKLVQDQGADEIDMVINIGAIKDNLWNHVKEDIKSVTHAVTIPVKVILETGLLTQEEIIKSSKVAEEAGAQFIKTCTGFASGNATIEHVKLMRSSVSSKVQVKASGGIKTMEQAINLIDAGASRLGTSSGVLIINNQTPSPSLY